MWPKLVKNLALFSSAVLTGRDADGYPYSLRCIPQPDQAQHVLRLTLPADATLQTGPAGLLCHSHDEQLWDLKSFLVQGQLERVADGWVFRPQKFTPSAGLNGPFGELITLVKARRVAQRYLEKRRLPRPSVPWEAIKALRKQANENNVKPADR